jgi:hypothetical protein
MRRFWLFYLAFGIIACEVSYAAQSLYDAKGRRDPFTPLITSDAKVTKTGVVSGLMRVETLDEIIVEGVMNDNDPKKSVIILNGSVLREGEVAGNVKVVKLQADGAVISVNGVEGFKPIYKEENKQG